MCFGWFDLVLCGDCVWVVLRWSLCLTLKLLITDYISLVVWLIAGFVGLVVWVRACCFSLAWVWWVFVGLRCWVCLFGICCAGFRIVRFVLLVNLLICVLILVFAAFGDLPVYCDFGVCGRLAFGFGFNIAHFVLLLCYVVELVYFGFVVG